MKKKIFLSLAIILSLLLGAGYLGLFDPEWKKYSLESPYVDKYGQKAQRKSDETKIDPFYEKMNIKGLIYDYSIKERIIEESGIISQYDKPALLCSVAVYSLSENKENNILNYLNNTLEYINKEKDFYINSEITRKNDYFKNITKRTQINSIWLPANVIFAINAENVFDKIDDNGFVIDKTTAKYPNQWKQLELCLQDMKRKNGREFDKNDNRQYKDKNGRYKNKYLITEQFLSKNSNDSLSLKEKIKNTILSDKSFIKIDDNITCWYRYDPQGWLDNSYSADYWKDKPRLDVDTFLKESGYIGYMNYKKYGKAFHTGQKSFIDIYNVNEKIYIRIVAIYNDGLPYIARYCEE